MTGTLIEDGGECDRPIMMQKAGEALNHLDDASPKVSSEALSKDLGEFPPVKARGWRMEVCSIGSACVVLEYLECALHVSNSYSVQCTCIYLTLYCIKCNMTLHKVQYSLVTVTGTQIL